MNHVVRGGLGDVGELVERVLFPLGVTVGRVTGDRGVAEGRPSLPGRRTCIAPRPCRAARLREAWVTSTAQAPQAQRGLRGTEHAGASSVGEGTVWIRCHRLGSELPTYGSHDLEKAVAPPQGGFRTLLC